MRSFSDTLLCVCLTTLCACASKPPDVRGADSATDGPAADAPTRADDGEAVPMDGAAADLGADVAVAQDTVVEGAVDAGPDAVLDGTADVRSDDAPETGVVAPGDLPAVDASATRAELVGDWLISPANDGGSTGRQVLRLGARAEQSFRMEFGPECSGALEWSGRTWSANGSTLIFAGAAACRGLITCTSGMVTSSIDCLGGIGPAPLSTCSDYPYTLSPDGRTLTLSRCTAGLPMTFTRL